MKRIACATLALACSSALAAPPQAFEQRVESLRKEIGVPQ